LHEDWGTTPAVIDHCLRVAEKMDVQVSLTTANSPLPYQKKYVIVSMPEYVLLKLNIDNLKKSLFIKMWTYNVSFIGHES